MKKIIFSALLATSSIATGTVQEAKASESLVESATAKRRQALPLEQSSVQQIAEGVYAGQSRSPSGETIYFGMERVDEDNADIRVCRPNSMVSPARLCPNSLRIRSLCR